MAAGERRRLRRGKAWKVREGRKSVRGGAGVESERRRRLFRFARPLKDNTTKNGECFFKRRKFDFFSYFRIFFTEKKIFLLFFIRLSKMEHSENRRMIGQTETWLEFCMMTRCGARVPKGFIRAGFMGSESLHSSCHWQC